MCQLWLSSVPVFNTDLVGHDSGFRPPSGGFSSQLRLSWILVSNTDGVGHNSGIRLPSGRLLTASAVFWFSVSNTDLVGHDSGFRPSSGGSLLSFGCRGSLFPTLTESVTIQGSVSLRGDFSQLRLFLALRF